MDDEQSQGTGLPQSTGDALAEMKAEAQTLAERSKTVDERLARATEAVSETQPEPMPSSNQTQTEETKPTPEIARQSQESEQLMQPDSLSENEALANAKNPDRTREYIEKQKAEIQQLKEELRKAAGNSVFDSLRQPEVAPDPLPEFNFQNLNQAQQQMANNFIQEDGTVDIDGLNRALHDAQSKAQLAEIEAQRVRQRVQQLDERSQVNEAHSLYPELDPKSEKFDQNFYDLTALRLAKSGMKLTLAQAAGEVRKTYTPIITAPINLDKVRDEAIISYKEAQDKKLSQAPLSSSQGEQRQVETPDTLRAKTRQKGDITQNSALDERLRRAGVIR